MKNHQKCDLSNFLNARDQNGKTSLWYAYQNGNINLFKKIIEHGADLTLLYVVGTDYFGEKKVTIEKGIL